MSKDLECPYCGNNQDVCHDDGFGYEEDIYHEVECERCEKNFVFTTCIYFSYSEQKADCLNGGNHILSLSQIWPIEYSIIHCKNCEYTRNMTEDERAFILQTDDREKFYNKFLCKNGDV
jgi:hypothetical protein